LSFDNSRSSQDISKNNFIKLLSTASCLDVHMLKISTVSALMHAIITGRSAGRILSINTAAALVPKALQNEAWHAGS